MNAPDANPGLSLNIERIVLDGVNLSAQEQRQFSQALQQELTRLLSAGTWPQGLAVPRLQAAPVSLPAQNRAAGLGRQIAHSVHASLMQAASGAGEPAATGQPVPGATATAGAVAAAGTSAVTSGRQP